MFRLRQNRRRPTRRPITAQIDRIEALEARLVLAATVTLNWGRAMHDITLTVENGSDPGPPGGELTINQSQFTAGSANFSGLVIGPSSGFPPSHTGPGLLDLLFYVDGAAEPTATVSSFTGPSPSPIEGRAQLTFSGLSIPLTANATHSLVVRAKRAADPIASAVTATPSLSIRVDTTSPQVNTVGPVIPGRRDSPVPSVDVTFSEPVDLSTFNFEDLTLTRDAGPNLISSAVTVDLVSGSTYRIGGLTGLTGAAGNYVLTVNATTVRDLAGNDGTATASTSWTFDPLANQPPPPGVPVLEAGSDTGARDNVTAAVNPVFDISGAAPGNTLLLLRDGVVVNSRVGSGPVTDPAPSNGVFTYTAVQVGVGPDGLTSNPSGGLSVVIDRLAPTGSAQVSLDDQSFTGNTLVSTADRRPSLTVPLTDQPTGFANHLDVELVSIDGRATRRTGRALPRHPRVPQLRHFHRIHPGRPRPRAAHGDAPRDRPRGEYHHVRLVAVLRPGESLIGGDRLPGVHDGLRPRLPGRSARHGKPRLQQAVPLEHLVRSDDADDLVRAPWPGLGRVGRREHQGPRQSRGPARPDHGRGDSVRPLRHRTPG